ncbi:MAG: truB [Acidobacteria bacterium]|nr:truB [Acidobacteriota bacterium]
MPDGLLIIDKPSGPTSHDVVARIRRALREKRIGHTGTLDPMATGVLLLVVGKATRLAKFLNASDKGYDATVRFGFATDTADAQGRPLGPPSDRPMPSRDAIEAALDAFRGTFLQQPPAFSAKKIDGQRSYKLARDARDTRDIRAKPPRGEDGADAAPGTAPPAPAALDPARGTPHLAPVAVPAPCRVTAHAIRIVRLDGDHLTLTIDCSAGFYIRSLAHDLGERLGIGAHLTALRRTRVGDFGLDRALTLDSAERDPDTVPAALVPLAAMLPGMGCVTLTAAGVTRALHGQDVRTIDHEPSALSAQPFVRLLDPAGELVAIAAANRVGGALHPSVVLV